MSEEQQATDGQQLPASVLPEATDAPKQENAPDDNYQGKIDFSTLPDDIRKPVESRINVLTKKIGSVERKYQAQLNEWQKVAQDQSRIIEELQSNVGTVVDHLQGKSFADAESRLLQELQTAHENGDTKALIKAQKELSDLSAKKALAERDKANKPKKEPQVKMPRNAADIADEGEFDGEITSDDSRAIKSWQNEMDDSGGLLRPWAHARTANPQDDKRYVRALATAQDIWEDPRYPTTQEKLAALDRAMGTPNRASAQNVMGGSLTSQGKKSKITLTPFQEQLAVKTKFGGAKAKSAQDHIEAFRKQVETYNAKKGAR